MKRFLGLGVLFLCLIIGSMTVFAETTYDLRYNLEKGSTYDMRMMNQMKMNQSFLGQSMDVNMITQTEMVMTVIEAKDHTFTVEYEYKKSATQSLIRMTDPEGNVTPSADSQDLSDVLKGIKMETTMTDKGKVVDISGFNDMMEKTLNHQQDQLGSEETIDETAVALQEQFSEEKLSQMWDNIVSYFPEEPVAIGDTWEQTMTISEPMPMEITIVSELKEVSEDGIIIGMTSTFTMNNEQEIPGIPDVPDMMMQMEAEGTMIGETILDPDSRWLKSMELSQTITGFFTIETGDEEMGTIKFPLSIEAKSSMISD